MDQVINILSSYAWIVFTSIVITLLSINIFLRVVKHTIASFDIKSKIIEDKSNLFLKKAEEFKKESDSVDISCKHPPDDCKNCQMKEIDEKFTMLKKQSDAYHRKTLNYLKFIRFVLWLVQTPIGRVLLYFGNTDLQSDSSLKPEGKS